MTWTQSQRQVFANVRGVTWGNLVPPFRFVALFFACTRDDSALSEYPESADCFNDILETRHRFWARSPRIMAKPAHSQIGGFGGVRGVTWSHRFSLWRFFLHVHGKIVHFLNIQKVPIAPTTFRETRHRFLGGVTQNNGKTCPQSNRGFWRCPGSNLVPPFQFVAFFFACAREHCALSEYPRSADCFNDILGKRHRFLAGSPRKMAKPAHSQIGGFGGVGGGTWCRRFSLWRFFLHVHGKTVHFLNIQDV